VINIFPSGRLCSLRGVLMMWLLPVFLLVGTVSAAGAYWTYTRMVATFMDDQMSLLAESLSAQSGSPVLPTVGARQVHERGAYAVQVYGRSGGLQAASWQGLPVGFLDKPGFHDVRAGGALWRVYVSDDQGPQHVQVAQSGSFRAHLAAERALAVIAPVLVLLLLSGLILWGVVEMISRSIGDIARQAARQDEHSIAELPLSHVPREIKPLVASFNSLLTRLRDAFTTQRRFVQDAAHELRTPIAAIGLQLETLRGDVGRGATRERFPTSWSRASSARSAWWTSCCACRGRSPSPRGDASADGSGRGRPCCSEIHQWPDRAGRPARASTWACCPLTVTQRARCAVRRRTCAALLDNLIENALRYTP
jgi:two-component system OmpR family sensor kinase